MYKYEGVTNNIYINKQGCLTSGQLMTNGYELFKNPNGIVSVKKKNVVNTDSDILKYTNIFVNHKTCCESLGYKFDIETQTCYWTDIPSSCSDCTTKIVYNPKDNDGVIFKVNDGETCSLNVSLDYILNFDCDLFNKTCNTPSINPAADAITNLENLQIYLTLEVEGLNNTYSLVYEESIFNIGSGNLLNFILNNSPNTGILISGATAGGILQSPFKNTSVVIPNTNCNTYRDEFIKELYLTQYKGNYPDPTTPDEQLALNTKMNDWYNSSWLYYNKIMDDVTISKIKNKKIKISLRIENCCLDLCILTDNLNLTKTCESLHNQEIIISESPKFEIERVMDNRKSWVSYTETSNREHDLQFRETQYSIDDYRLTINTKEIDLKIDGANAIEEDVLCVIDYLITGSTGTTINSCITGPNISGCTTVNLDTFLTTDLPSINNVDEFRKAVNAELIDVKNRQTINAYPTLRLLYERYLGNCGNYDKPFNKFTYNIMDTFIDLIGKHWVDLAEQFVPATTIWGATDVYRNITFHQQKHKYRRSNLEFKRFSNGVINTIDWSAETIIYDITPQAMPEVLPTSATTINFQAAAQIDETPRSNPDTPIKLNFQTNTVIQTFGNLTTQQLNDITSQIDTVTNQLISSNVFQIKKSINYALASGPAHCSPMFYGKITDDYTKSLYE